MKKAIFLFLSIFIATSSFSQKAYKTLMNDLSVNFYDVCVEADKYFETHDKNVKGSGWKGYQRWKNANEYKYYPSGNRNNIDPFFPENAFKSFKKNNSENKSLFNNGWEELGPWSIDSITGHYSAGLGRIETVYVDPNDSNKIYIGSRSGGFWKSINGGVNWQGGSTDFLAASGVNTIAVSPTNSDSILINVRNSRNGYSHGVYRSTDGGISWSISNFNPITVGFGGLGSSFRISKIAYHPTIPNLIFIGTNYGIYKSNNNLTSWTRLLNTGDITEIAFHPTNSSIIYLYDNYYWGANEDYVMRSTDMGLSYSQSAQIIGNLDNTGHLSVSPICPNCLYFASTQGVWKSTNNGINFTFLNNPSQSCLGFAVNDTDTTNMIYGYVDIMATTDGGNTFSQVSSWSLGSTNGAGSGHQTSYITSTDYVHADLHPAICVNGVFYVGTDGLFAKSIDGGQNWQNLSQGLGIRENYKLGVSQSNHFRSVSGSQDNGTSIKHKDCWIEFYGADGMEGIIHPLNDDWIIGSLQNGGRRRTINGGQTQTGVSPVGQSGSGNAAWEAPIAYDPNNQMTVYNFSTTVYKSLDFGSTWNYVGSPTTFTGTISKAAIAENNSNIIVISRGDKIDKSINGGVSFVGIKNNLPNHSIEDIAFDPNNDDVIIVVNGRYENNSEKVYITTNGGASWTNITYNLGNMPLRSVIIDHTDSSNIYLGAEIGVYTMPINGNSWSLYNTNLPNCTVEEMEIVYGSNTIKAATWGRGMWEYAIVGRNDFPSIITTKITNQPTNVFPKESIDQFITSVISYNNTLSSVYVKWSINNPVFDNTISMINTIDSTWVSSTFIPSFPESTKIYFKVFAVGNNNDTTETYKFMYTVKPFDYCAATGNTSAGNLYISSVNLHTLSNNTNNNSYSLYTSPVTTLRIDSTYTITLNGVSGWAENDYAVWIDYNRDTEFSTSEEILYAIDAGGNASNTFTVPNNAVVSDTLLMRVRVSYFGDNPSPCNNQFGEVEDYYIILKDCSSMGIDVQTACFTYNWIDGNTYTSSNDTATYTLTNALGCDSVVTLNLTIDTVDLSLTVNGPTITANATGAIYQWLYCDTNFAIINGETSQGFTSITNGSYAVMITDGACTDTSACEQITGVGILQNNFNTEFKLYPNPTNGLLTIDMGNVYNEVKIQVKNDLGQTILSKEINHNNLILLNLNNQDNGVYFIHINSNNKVAVIKVIKE